MIDISVQDDMVLVPVKAVPGASRTRILGEWGNRLKVAVVAPPEKGRANKAIEELLAKTLGVSRRQISVVAGPASPLKTLSVAEVDVETIRRTIQEVLGHA